MSIFMRKKEKTHNPIGCVQTFDWLHVAVQSSVVLLSHLTVNGCRAGWLVRPEVEVEVEHWDWQTGSG